MRKIIISGIILFSTVIIWTNLSSWNYVKYSTSCFLGSSDGCIELARVYHEGDGVSQNSSKALKLVESACDSGYARGCALLARAYEYGYGVEINIPKSKLLYEKSYDGSYNKGWYCLGKLYEEEKEIENIYAVEQIYTKLYNNDVGLGCYNFGRVYLDKEIHLPTEADIKHEKLEVTEYDDKGCGLNDMDNCIWLGVIEIDDFGKVEKDTFKAAETLQEVCDSDSTNSMPAA